MKVFAAVVKYIVIPASSLVGIIYGFDMYVIGRAGTVVEPVKVELQAHLESGKVNRTNILDSIARIERNQEADRKLLQRILINTSNK